MEPKELKNYGIALSESSVNLPKKIDLKVRMGGVKIAFKYLGFLKFIRFMFSFTATAKKMQKQDFSKIREKGLNDFKFIKSQIELAAMYSSLEKIIGQERTIELFKEINETAANVLFPALYPLQEDFKKCNDPFNAFKELFISVMVADKKAGSHFFEIIENSNSAIQLNCTYCAWHEIAKLLGSEKIDLCYADDVFLPDFLKPLKIKYIRTNTLLRGGPFCDYRFERE